MNNLFLQEIWQHNRAMMGMEALINLYHLLTQTLLLKVPGSVVELGSYRGYTALAFWKTMEAHGDLRPLHCFDSFSGLPEKGEMDLCSDNAPMRLCDRKDNQRMRAGWFAVSQADFEKTFQEASCPLPHIHPGWFSETLPAQLPESIAFAHLDGDFYQSTLDGLEALYPRLSPGAVVVLDDYCDPGAYSRQNSLPGVKAACDAFFADKPETIWVLQAGPHQYQAYFRKS
ncbi:MAG: class I SAM-dependent methyltransferase [Chlamydiia bacterium]|nr:class I SAM-dependent methyltransferase [Chlamydiia bacterium]